MFDGIGSFSREIHRPEEASSPPQEPSVHPAIEPIFQRYKELIPAIKTKLEQIDSIGLEGDLVLKQDRLRELGILTYEECCFIDLLINWGAEFKKNKWEYADDVEKIIEIANKNTFENFQNGDVLFFNTREQNRYYQFYSLDSKEGLPFGTELQLTILSDLGHAGVFYRGPDGKPYISHVLEEHYLQPLSFGMQCFISGRRMNPHRFIGKVIEPEARKDLQKRFGDVFASVVFNEKNTEFGTFPVKNSTSRAIKTVLPFAGSPQYLRSGESKLPRKSMDEVAYKVKMICSEFVAVALVEAFALWNEENQLESMSSPFLPEERADKMHPLRLLTRFGRDSGASGLEPGWERVDPGEIISSIMPNYAKGVQR